MNDVILHRFNRDVFLYTKIEEYIVNGAMKDIINGVIDKQEWRDVFKLARLQTEVPGLFNRWLPPTDSDEVQDMSLTKMFFFKDKNKVVPKEELEAACKQFNKYSARCIVMDGELMIQREDTPPKADILFPETEGFIDYYEIIVLGNEPSNEDDIQPFVLLGGEKPELVCCIQGDTSILPEVQRKVNKMFKGADDFDDFWKDLKGSASSFQDIMKEDSAVLFFAHNDQFCAFQTAEIEKDQDWGASYGAAEPVDGGEEVQETRVEPVPGDALQKPKPSFKTSTSDSPASRISETQTNRVMPSGVGQAKIRSNDKSKIKQELRSRINDSTGVLTFKNKTEPFVRCPQMVSDGTGGTRAIHRDENVTWHEKHLGWVPENYKECPCIPVSFLITAVNIEELKSSASQTAIAAATGGTQISMKPDEASLKHFRELEITILGTNTEQVKNPVKMFEEDDKIDFLTLIGKDHTWSGLPWLGRLKVCIEDPENAARCWGAFQIISRNLRERCSLLEDNVKRLEEELASAKPKKPGFVTSK